MVREWAILKGMTLSHENVKMCAVKISCLLESIEIFPYFFYYEVVVAMCRLCGADCVALVSNFCKQNKARLPQASSNKFDSERKVVEK